MYRIVSYRIVKLNMISKPHYSLMRTFPVCLTCWQRSRLLLLVQCCFDFVDNVVNEIECHSTLIRSTLAVDYAVTRLLT